MKIDEMINKLSNDTDIYFYDFVQENDIIIAKSHFFDFYFGPTYVEVVNSYTLPGPILQDYLNEVLPFTIDYAKENSYDVLLDMIDTIHHNCIGAEHHDEWNDEKE